MPDIDEAALDAAVNAVETLWDRKDDADIREHLAAAIRAYEAALWRRIGPLPYPAEQVIVQYESGAVNVADLSIGNTPEWITKLGALRWRPLPQPPGDDEPRPMVGLLSQLTPEQRQKALDYRGPENHGDPRQLDMFSKE